jgi:DNA-directed RNA polymerase specialized sigma24 family protein
LFGSKRPKIANFRAEYAKQDDFCDVFERDTKPLYLLAFLLTTNNKVAERCFALTVEEAFEEQAVFKEWARSWVKRRLIENAIEIVSAPLARNGQTRDLWNAGHSETQRECEIDIVTKLSPFERFVFVMSILERYSNRDCALLLGCSIDKVIHARMGALRRLAHFAPFQEGNRPPIRGLAVTA